jgi:hypothetical protein
MKATIPTNSEVEGHSIEGDDGSWLIVANGECALMDVEDTAFRRIGAREAARWWLEQNTPAEIRAHLEVT